MTADIAALLITKATAASTTANIGETHDMCSVSVSMCNHLRMLICVVLMDGSGSYLAMTKSAMARQFLNEGLIQQQSRDRLVT